MLTKNQFELLNLCRNNMPTDQRNIEQQLGVSLNDLNSLLNDCREQGWITQEGSITEQGYNVLAPYKVENAIIMAAGMSSRFAPLSYEKPKGLLVVKGEILIERQIEQLQSAGITDITIVVGYMKEQFFYLEDKYDVSIVVNDDYYRYNNTSTLMKVLDKLGNTYICSSDNYFTENVFEEYVYQAYYSAVYTSEETDEYCLTTDTSGRITKVKIGGGPDTWYMLGHVYYSREFSDKFIPILKKEYEENSIVKEQLWEQLYMRHLDELSMYIRKYDDTVIKEFDSLDELRQFDERYINHTDSAIIGNICSVLKCEDEDVVEICAMKNSLTDTAFQFCCKGKKYIYCHPSVEFDEDSCCDKEVFSEDAIREFELAHTLIYVDSKKGWRLYL